jgi:hypothetical protein
VPLHPFSTATFADERQLLYFASGAYDYKQQQGELLAPVPTVEKEIFVRELGPTLDELASLGFPRLVHHLLETLEFLVDVDHGPWSLKAISAHWDHLPLRPHACT